MLHLITTRHVSVDEGYRQWSDCYDTQPNPMLTLEQRYLDSLLPAIKGRDIVDLGCGTGRWLEKLAQQAPGSLIGIDSSAAMLARAAKKIGHRAVLLHGNCENPAVESSSVDLIICSFTLSYVADIDRFFGQLRRIAREGADVFITDLHPESEQRLGWQRGFRQGRAPVNVQTHWRPLLSILSVCERHGFTPVAFIEPYFGEPEFAILDRAGKTHLIEELRKYPATYILQLRSGCIRQLHLGRTSPCNGVSQVTRCRVAIGALEDARADIEINDGRIACLNSRASKCCSSMDGFSIDLSGFLVLPGLINSHDHLEFALFPRLGNRGYANFREWSADIHKPEVSPVCEHRAVPKETRLWWGGVRNLLSGVTTVCHHNPYVAEVFDQRFPVRVLREFGWAHSIPIDTDIAEKHANTPREHPFIVHVAEGVDPVSAAELTELDRCGALNERAVIVHGLALADPQQIALIQSRGAALVWCPTSNEFLFGQTHSRKTIEKLSRVALGSDSSLTARGDLLDEIRFACQEVGISAESLYLQVTLGAAEVARLRSGEGSLRVGAMADLVAIRDRGLTPAETLALSTYRDIELVIVGGRVQLVSEALRERLNRELAEGLERLVVDTEVRWIRAPLARLFDDASRVLGTNLRMNGRPLRRDCAA